MQGLLLLAVFIVCDAAADTGNYLIDVWTGGANGLPNSSVTAVAQTPEGYLWVGTYNGLARFDGVRFKRFDPRLNPELKRSRIRRLLLDEAATLWINTYDGSLTSCREGRFQLEWIGDGSPDAVVSLVTSRSNQPVFLLHTGEMIRRRLLTREAPSPAQSAGVAVAQTGRSENQNSRFWDVLRPPGATSGELCAAEGSGAIWCRGRDQKLWRFINEHFEEVPTNSSLAGQSITCLVADPQGRVWVGTEKEIAVWDGTRFQGMTPTNGEPVLSVSFLYHSPAGEIWSIANERVRKARGRQWVLEASACRGLFTRGFDRLGLQDDRHGGAWIYHYGKGLFHIRATDGQTEELAKEENFPGERVDCFFEDREANLWAGVDRGGLVRLREKRFSVLAGVDSATSKAAVTVAEDRHGAIWIGTYGAGLQRWQDGAWQAFALPGGSQREFVFSVCPDAEDRLWVSAGEEDLFVRSNGRFEPVLPAVHGVKALLAGCDGRVWIGTKRGLACWTNGAIRFFQSTDGVKRTDVRALAEDGKGVIWAGMGDGTLYRIQSNHIASFQAQDQLGAQPIWSLCSDAEGTVWVGTFRGGLMRFRDERFVRFTSKDGLPDDVISQILDDGNGRLWIGSEQGIFCVAKTNLHAFAIGGSKTIDCTVYGRYDGLPSLECSGNYQPAAWRGSDGHLFFSTLMGVVSVQPADLTSNRLPPPVLIEEVLVDGQLQTANTKDQTLVLRVGPGKRYLQIRYTGLSFVSPDRVRFRYRLEGLEKEWMEVGTRREAQYSFLRPGDYSFRVSACNNDGIWNDQCAALAFKVLPHFYETWWFLGIAGVGVLGGVAGGVRAAATRKYRRALAKLEQQHAIERDRARIAKDIHDDLGAGLTQITLLSELARREPAGQAGAHLERISESARKMTRAMDEIVWAVDPQADTLNGLMDYISAFTEDFLRTAGIRCRMDLPNAVPTIHVEAELRYNLFLALKESLNNIVKHANATEVWLRLQLDAEAFTLLIEDNGQGLTEGPTAGDGTRLASGHGLSNLAERLSAFGGRCVVRSAAGQGTRIEMTVSFEPSPSPIVATRRNGTQGAE